ATVSRKAIVTNPDSGQFGFAASYFALPSKWRVCETGTTTKNSRTGVVNMSAIKKLAIAVAIGLAGTASAMATDLYVAPADPVFFDESAGADWYFGFHKGYGWGLADHLPGPNFPGPAGGNDIDLTGFLAGIQVGVMFPSNSALRFGIEKDIEWTNISGSCISLECSAAFDPYTASINWEGSKRVRVGFALGDDGNVMPYLTGGLAFANVTRGSDSGGGTSETLNVFGWTAGGGIEVFTDSNVSFFGEARYTAYRAREFDTGGTPPNTAFSKTTIRAGINWHIN
ncbi:MAG: outer membrane beta-barrel protein, partial [Cucumibacter sp.]